MVGSEVEAIERGVGCGVPMGQGRQIPDQFDELEDRGVIEGRVRDIARFGERSGDDSRNPETEAVISLVTAVV